MIKKILRILVIFLLCASAIFVIAISVKTLPHSYLLLIFLGALIFIGGQIIFHNIIKKKLQDNVSFIKTLDFIFSVIWFVLIFYLIFKAKYKM